MKRCVFLIVALTVLCEFQATSLDAQEKPSQPKPLLPETWAKEIPWRSIGPANMSGRITALAVYEKDPTCWWAASASGGLLKTVNNGTTFEHQFDDQATVSIGDVKVFQGDPKIVWVGTGEANPRNSVSWGDGVYRSTDGGKTWKNVGLGKIFQTGRIELHPTDPDTAYVGALGRLWGPSEDRGLYKTHDGGKTWRKVLYVDDKTGVIDLQMHPADPETLLVATYERQRGKFDGNDPEKKFGPGSGIFLTNDGGKSFSRVTDGLPSCNLGRIGLSWYRKDPDFVYAIIESEKIGQDPPNAAFAGITGENADAGARMTKVTAGGPAAKAGLEEGDIVISAGDQNVLSYNDFLTQIRTREAGDTLPLVVSRGRKPVELVLTLGKRPVNDANQSRGNSPAQPSRALFGASLGGQRPNVQDQQGKTGLEYGGVYRSDDAGRSWQRINSVNPRPMYYSQIRVDPQDNNFLYVLGTSLYRSRDGGKTFTSDGADSAVHVDHHALWVSPDDGRHMILGNDGGLYMTHDRMDHWDHFNHIAIGQFYHVGIGPNRNYRVYGGLQDNGSWGGPSRVADNGGPVNSDWFRVGGGDGFICLVDPLDADQIYYESQNGAMGRIHLRTGERGYIRPRAPKGTSYRFNWKTPFILSPHNSTIHYSAGNHVFRSIFKGNSVKPISPEITNTKQGAGSAISESGTEQGVLYVGTTDGALWTTDDGGNRWVNLFEITREQLEKEERKKEEAAAKATREQTRKSSVRSTGPGSSSVKSSRPVADPAVAEPTKASTEDQTTPDDESKKQNAADESEESATDKTASTETTSAPAPKTKGETEMVDPDENEDIETQTSQTERPLSVQRESDPQVDVPREGDKEIAGNWAGTLSNENIARERGRFSLTLTVSDDGRIAGTFTSPLAVGEISRGSWDDSEQLVTLTVTTELAEIQITGNLQGDTLTGQLEVGDRFTSPFQATRKQEATAAKITGDPIRELVPDPRWVSSLEASKHKSGRCYMTLDGHRSDDDRLYLFVTENYGRTWASLVSNLPDQAGPCRVIREDVSNPDLLFLGCEFSAWVSIDRGKSWTKLNATLPTVAVHEFAIHPTAGEVVAATHGRSLWVANVSTLRQMTPETIQKPAHLYAPAPAIKWRGQPSAGSSGTRRFVGQNPSSTARFEYSLGKNANRVMLQVTDLQGNEMMVKEGEKSAGLHVVGWDLRRASPSDGSGRRLGRGSTISIGEYLVTLTVDGVAQTQVLKVEGDPDLPHSATTEDELEWMDALLGTDEEGSEWEDDDRVD